MGHGTFINSAYNDVYIGTFVNNLMESYCKVTYSTNDIYIGEMKEGKLDGLCTYYNSKGGICN